MVNDNATKVSVIAYFLSKFDKKAVNALGFTSFSNAFNSLSPLLGKGNNYMKYRRDEFDAIVSSVRSGWKNRQASKQVLAIHNELKAYSFQQMLDIAKYIIKENSLPSDLLTAECADSCENVETLNQKSNVNIGNDINEYLSTLNNNLHANLLSVGRTLFVDRENSIAVIQLASREYTRSKMKEYWYSIHPKQFSNLSGYKTSYFSFILASTKAIVLIETSRVFSFLGGLTTTTTEKETYWHIKIQTDGKAFWIPVKGKKVVITENVINSNCFTNSKELISESRDCTTSISENIISENIIKIRSHGFHEVKVKKTR